MALAVLLGTAAPAAAAPPLPAPALLAAENYSETYSLTAYGHDGVVQLQFGVTNLGWGSGRGICRLYLQLGADRVRKHEMSARGEWRTYGGPVTALAAPACRLEAAGALRFSAEIEGDRVEVAAVLPLAPVPTPQTRVEHKKGFYRSQVLLAASPATVVWRRAGRERVFAADAHLDHSVTTLLPRDIAAGWFRFRALHGGAPSLFSLRLAPGGDAFEGWRIEGAQVSPLAVAPPAWWPRSLTGFEIELPEGKLVIGRQVEVFEPLRDLGVLRSAAELLVGRPKTVLYRAALAGREGLLEVSTQE